MTGEILALYDITGIQNYIFATNKLKDIIGASCIIKDVLDKTAEDLLKGLGNVVYIGGGNALFEFYNKDNYIKFNRRFSRELLVKAPGVNFVTEYCDNKGDLGELRKKLYTSISLKKNIAKDNCQCNILPIMMQSNVDRQQVTHIETSDDGILFLSHAAMVKNDRGDKETSNTKFKDTNTIAEPFVDMTTKDGIAKFEAQNLLAVVHIDGNNMGELIDKAFCNAKNANDMKNVSQNVNYAFEDSLRAIESAFPELPFRKIYQNGDDVTFVCHSAYALSAVEIFFKELQKHKKNELKDLSASAGIAFTKPHFPISKAYNIAESRCKNAKKIAKNRSNSHDIGCWLDFEVIRGSDSTNDLEAYELRPYYVTGLAEDISLGDIKYAHFGVLMSILKSLDDKKARSKIKALRNAFVFSDINYVAAKMSSLEQSFLGEYDLYTGKAKGESWDFSLDMKGSLQNDNDITPVYDALDIMDINISREVNE